MRWPCLCVLLTTPLCASEAHPHASQGGRRERVAGVTVHILSQLALVRPPRPSLRPVYRAALLLWQHGRVPPTRVERAAKGRGDWSHCTHLADCRCRRSGHGGTWRAPDPNNTKGSSTATMRERKRMLTSPGALFHRPASAVCLHSELCEVWRGEIRQCGMKRVGIRRKALGGDGEPKPRPGAVWKGILSSCMLSSRELSRRCR